MKMWTKPMLIFTVLIALGVLTWAFVPNPFLRGLLVGVSVGAGLLFGVIGVVAIRARKGMAGHLRPPNIPVAKWDHRMTAVDLEGTEVDFREFEGRVLILSFWATWCAPCVAEMPSLARLAEATSDLDVVLACVTREPVEVVKEFVRKRKLDLPVYVVEGNPPECFATRAIPATFILDREGGVAMRHMGAAAWDDEKVVAFVRGMAAVPRV